MNISIGQMFAFAKMNEWDKLDDMLMKLDSELWLSTAQFTNLADFVEFINIEFGVDLYSEDEK